MTWFTTRQAQCAIVWAAAVLLTGSFMDTAWAVDPFLVARGFTVRIKTSVAYPFRRDSQGTWYGTGILVDRERGWILTNAHVSGRSPSVSWVSWQNHAAVTGSLQYVDPVLDLALIAIDPTHIPATAREASLRCEGTPAIGTAIGLYGHPRREYFRGAQGIVSGLTSNLKDFPGEYLHVDAPTNPGNSGGPLIELASGRVLGVMTCGKDDSQGMNYALAISQACRVLALLRNGQNPAPPRLPVNWVRTADEPRDARVARVFGQPAGYPLLPGDQIVRVIGGTVSRLRSPVELTNELRGRGPSATLEVLRPVDGAPPKTLQIELPLVYDAPIAEREAIHFSGITAQFDDDVVFREVGMPAPQLLITHVDAGSEGDSQEVRHGDAIVAVDGKPISSLRALRRALAGADKTVTLHLRRLDYFQGRLFSDYFTPMEVRRLKVIRFSQGPIAGQPDKARQERHGALR